jgi:hypothetical protein
VILRKQDAGWEPVSLKNFENEEHLQTLLAAHPDLIPGCAGTATVTEFVLPGNSRADVVCVDVSGTVTIVECKLAGNPQVRREVVGQILSYASLFEGMSYADFARRFAERTDTSLVEAIRKVAAETVDEEALGSALSETLDAGRFRLVLAVDEITAELQRIVEYLNRHLGETVAILALELGYLAIGGEQLLVPATYGAEIAETAGKGGSKKAWAADEVRDAVSMLAQGEDRRLVERLLSHATKCSASIKGGVGKSPSAGFYYLVSGAQPSIWSLYVHDDGPAVAVNLGSIRNADEGRAQDALEALRSSTVLDSKFDGVEDPLSKYPSYRLRETLIADPGAGERLVAAIAAASGVPVPPDAAS